MSDVVRLHVADVLRSVGKQLREAPLSSEQRRALSCIEVCRTPALGGRLYACPQCGLEEEIFHSCRDRHCPNCQAAAQNAWIRSREQAMLPVPHFHLVFTLPSALRAICRAFPRSMYALLLRSCGEILIELGEEEYGAQLGVTMVLHTWTRELSYHPHVHCIVSAGGWNAERACFVPTKQRRYLFAVARLKAMFRARFLRGLRGLVQQGKIELPGRKAWSEFERALPAKKHWVVFAQAPFGQFTHVVSYLGRYTHRIAISDSRLRKVSKSEVSFTTRDGKLCTLSPLTFGLRFLQHVLPKGFKKIRHYGLYASGSRQRAAAQAVLREQSSRPTEPCPAEPEQKEAAGSLEEPSRREHRCPKCDAVMLFAHEIPRIRSPPSGLE